MRVCVCVCVYLVGICTCEFNIQRVQKNEVDPCGWSYSPCVSPSVYWEESLVLSHLSNLKGAFLLFLSKSCRHGKVMMNPECGFLYARERKMLSLNPQNMARGVIL